MMMSENGLTHVPTQLEAASQVPLPSADELAGRFALQPNQHPASEEEYREIMDSLSFGSKFGDHMAVAEWKAGEGWSGHRVQAFENLSLSPGAVVFHYGQEVFEGLKAYRHKDGSIWAFRPRYNAARLNASARRLALPEIPEADFVASVVDLVRADKRWVPTAPNTSLYLRPFLIATEPYLGVHSANEAKYLVIGSPSGAYFSGGEAKGVSIWVDRHYHRAGPGGTGEAKCGGNYAASLLPQNMAAEKGYEQVCFLDTTHTNLEELGGMNVFVVRRDGSVHTPRLTGVILEGGTRSAICRLLRDSGTPVFERDISLESLVDNIRSGEVSEVFACGTAAVVTPIGRLGSDDFEVEVPCGPVTASIHQRLVDIQNGEAPDPYGWTYQLCD